MELPGEFVRNVILACPHKGEEWLNDLPQLITYCETNWKLKMHSPYKLSFNYVAPATIINGGEVVVKLGLPEEGHHDERLALRSLNKQGIVQLVDEDPVRRILILEKIEPGQMLAEWEDDQEATKIAAKVIDRLLVPAGKHMDLPTTRNRENNLKQICEDNPGGLDPISSSVLNQALAVFAYMNRTIKEYKILHGDFHHYNVLKNGDQSWVAIDPKGLIGETEYDLIQFLLNKLPEHGKFETIQERINILTEMLTLNKERLLLWGFCHAVLSTSWTVDKQTGQYNKKFYEGIDIFKTMYENTFNRSLSEALM
ncbi:aminoglycoside phosphotransferase family protein [Halobacillus sp. A1]|uniref:aminoglycoside phosphotransferase family protein n=1 Tax=Halobacillus sp. A1 TaxID=2880262 RepID=UPI0020A61D37|nr:aminoglycoside phosphotransferase family protein [Halobacillus sp. A1]MCP3030036.1 aminoglycoside phosphotransferase family protein [Halobacillus sp. A1]